MRAAANPVRISASIRTNPVQLIEEPFAMPTAAMVEYDQATPDVRAIYDEIMAVKSIDFVPNFWKTLASHPPLLARVWRGLDEAMRPGALDALTKEMVALAVSATNGCTYCIRSHTAAARKLGMDDAMLGELMAVVGTFNQTNRLADGYQVEVDPQIMRATEGASRPAEAGSGKRKAAKSKSKGKQPKSKPKRARKAA
jgi:AhpD family alkylhydroperoxidase